tara:strand:+ start:69 stop:419 length:351 start_codon:yes stop_codon:yes gene_type:complete
MIKQLTSDKLKDHIKNNPSSLLLDVRTPEEWKQDGKPDGEKIGIKTIFLTILDDSFAEEFKKLNIKNDKEILVMCMSGARSHAAAQLLVNEDYRCINIVDGILGWKNNNLPVKFVE